MKAHKTCGLASLSLDWCMWCSPVLYVSGASFLCSDQQYPSVSLLWFINLFITRTFGLFGWVTVWIWNGPQTHVLNHGFRACGDVLKVEPSGGGVWLAEDGWWWWAFEDDTSAWADPISYLAPWEQLPSPVPATSDGALSAYSPHLADLKSL